MGHFGSVELDAFRVDDVDVGLVARCEYASVEESVELCRVLGHAMNRLLDRDAAPSGSISHPVREHECRKRCVTDDAAVGASIAEAENRPLVVDHFEHGTEVTIAVVEEGEEQKLPAFVLEHVVVQDFLGRSVLLFGNSSNALFRSRLIVGRVAQRKHLPEHFRNIEQGSEARSVSDSFASQDPLSNCWILESRHSLGQGQVGDFRIGGPIEKGVGLGLVTGQDAKGSGGELRDHIRASYDMIVAALSKKKRAELGL